MVAACRSLPPGAFVPARPSHLVCTFASQLCAVQRPGAPDRSGGCGGVELPAVGTTHHATGRWTVCDAPGARSARAGGADQARALCPGRSRILGTRARRPTGHYPGLRPSSACAPAYRSGEWIPRFKACCSISTGWRTRSRWCPTCIGPTPARISKSSPCTIRSTTIRRNIFAATWMPFPWSRDPRNYVFRAGLQGWVASPTAEMVDDVVAARLGIHQRWQTKRGLPGQQRVVDWIVLDIDGTIFPDKDRDNFSAIPGLAGIRFPLARGRSCQHSLGRLCRFLPGGAEGDFVRNRHHAPATGTGVRRHRVAWKVPSAAHCWWDGQLSTESQVDLGHGGHLRSGSHRQHRRAAGDHACRRIDAGAIAANADFGRDNFGMGIAVEPRFMPKGRLGRIGDMPIPPLGSMGIE